MGEKVSLGDLRSYSAIEHLESVLEDMGHSTENLEGKYESCEYEAGNERMHDLGAISYYLRTKATIDDFDQLKEVRDHLTIRQGYDFLEKHVVGCKRCLRTLKIALERKPKLQKDELERLSSALLLKDEDKNSLLEKYVNKAIIN